MPAENNSIWTVSALGRLFQQRILNTWTYTPSTLDLAPSDVDLLDKIILEIQPGGGGADKLETAFRACHTSQYVLESWQVQKIHPNRTAFRRTVRNLAGTHIGTCTTPNIATSLTKRTVLGGRRFVGRTQLACVAGANTDAGLLIDANGYFAALTAFQAAMLTPLTGLGLSVFAPCLAHKPYAQFPPTVLSSVTRQSTVRTMHRRTVGLGE